MNDFIWFIISKMCLDIVFFGIQWSGKWTQAVKLINDYPIFKYLEPGNVFRAITSNDNIISKHIKDRMIQWKMLDDSLTLDLFNMYGHLLTSDDVMLLDGFPRTISQMYYFLSREYQYKRDFVAVHFYITREEAIKRIVDRAREQNRLDDLDMDVVNHRLDLFEKETLPVIQHFEAIGKLITIDANNSIESIYKEVLEKLEI